MTEDCLDYKDIGEQFRRQNAVGNMLVIKFSFAHVEQKYNCSSHIVSQFMDVLFGVIHTNTLLENLLSVIVAHSNYLFMSPDTPAQLSYLRRTQLTLSIWCTTNRLTA